MKAINWRLRYNMKKEIKEEMNKDLTETALKRILIELSHKYKMEEIKYRFDCEEKILKMNHELDLERGRIKTAEIRKSQMRKFENPFHQ
jgi:hypothetical protein